MKDYTKYKSVVASKFCFEHGKTEYCVADWEPAKRVLGFKREARWYFRIFDYNLKWAKAVAKELDTVIVPVEDLLK